MFLGASWPVRLLGHLPVPGSGSVFAAAAFRHAYSINPQETNMLRALRAFWLAAACLFVVATQANAQVVYQTQPASKLWIEGTSNKSDWSVNATEFSGTVTMKQDVTPADPGVSAVKLTVASGKIVSNKSTIMDRLIVDALQVEQHPTITYELVSATPAGANGNAFTLQTKGRLTLAGTTKEIDMEVQGEKLADGQVRFQGEHELLMSDYGIQPPSAMFGALRTADKTTVKFDLVVAPGN